MNTKQLITLLIYKINQKLQTQVNEILHHAAFQKLEASWRGVQQLVMAQSELDCETLKLRLLDVSYAQLCKDLIRASDFDQSHAFKLIYTAEFDQPGGEPYGLLIGDYEISHKTHPEGQLDGVSFLREMAKIAAASFTVFTVAPSPALFGLDDFSGLTSNLNFYDIFRQEEYQRWRQMRNQADMRFLGLVMPKVLMRKSYQHDLIRGNQFFSEVINSEQDLCWGNAGYSYAMVVMRAYAQSGWLADIRGYHGDLQNGGAIQHQLHNTFAFEQHALNHKMITNTYIPAQLEHRLSELGIMALCDQKFSNFSCFYSCQSLQVANRYDKEIASNNALLSTMLNAVLCASRFSHYIKVMMRDKVGSFTTTEECQTYIQAWILGFCTANSDISFEMKSRYPLRSAQVQVEANPAAPEKFNCVLQVQPHYQFDYLESHLKMATEIMV